ncbi:MULTISPECIES: GcrA family cell cycle regulator [Bradyrhizobium]|jgi:GcrA cell cycle regulator|nr:MULTISPECIES: GcrA family cell cycle regulator [Bradyrhizobium]MBR0879499.1 GcrA cell cycle regulator [Bradyrhizobium liaoningense]MBR1066897.1 GcrA cell cycle regulator [Bradyrhizobium liaoningense]MDI2075523.1 GcrA family cell cycle regulator [Bradyrhizobium sp. Mp27]
MTMPLTWTDDRVEQLKKLWEAGLSASQMAAEIGNVTRNAVIGKIHRLGLSGRTKGHETKPRKSRTPRPSSPAPSRRVLALRQAIDAASDDTHAANLEAAGEFDPAAISVSDAEIPAEVRVKSILDLGDGDCRFPIGEVGTEAFYFCGRGGRKLDGLPYCARHARIAYASPAERRAGVSDAELERRAALGRRMAARGRSGRAA